MATLYRSGMGPEARQREREVQRELQDRETELRGVLAEVGGWLVKCGVQRELQDWETELRGVLKEVRVV